MKSLFFLIILLLIMSIVSGCISDTNKQENSTVYPITRQSHQTGTDNVSQTHEHSDTDTGSTDDTESKADTHASESGTAYEKKKIEEFYPLHERAGFEPRYAWDPINYWERVILRHGDLALLLCTYGGKGSDIEVYQITDDSIYEVYKLPYEFQENSDEYKEIMSLIDQNNRHKLIEFLERVHKTSTQKKVVLKYPLEAGTSWEGGRVVTPDTDELVAQMPEWLMKSGKITDKDVFVVKTEVKEGYFVYKKEVGIVAYYHPIVLQFQE